MTYYVYEYPNGYGCISHLKLNNYLLKATCSTIGEAKEKLKEMVQENYIKSKRRKG